MAAGDARTKLVSYFVLVFACVFFAMRLADIRGGDGGAQSGLGPAFAASLSIAMVVGSFLLRAPDNEMSVYAVWLSVVAFYMLHNDAGSNRSGLLPLLIVPAFYAAIVIFTFPILIVMPDNGSEN